MDSERRGELGVALDSLADYLKAETLPLAQKIDERQRSGAWEAEDWQPVHDEVEWAYSAVTLTDHLITLAKRLGEKHPIVGLGYSMAEDAGAAYDAYNAWRRNEDDAALFDAFRTWLPQWADTARDIRDDVDREIRNLPGH